MFSSVQLSSVQRSFFFYGSNAFRLTKTSELSDVSDVNKPFHSNNKIRMRRSPAPTSKDINNGEGGGRGGSGSALKMIMVLMTMMTIFVMTMTACPSTVDALVPPTIKQRTSASSSRLTFTTTTRRQMSSTSTSKTTTTKKKTTTTTTTELITNESKVLADAILQQMEDESLKLGLTHSEMYGLDEDDEDEDQDSSSKKTTTTTCAGLYALLHAISKTATLGLKGRPFVVRKSELERIMMLVMSSSSSQSSSSSSSSSQSQMTKMFASWFTMDDLELALEDDFLDAARGSTDKNKAWQITTVSEPLGDSFEEARMTIEDVNKALELGTVIFNAAGAHIPKLAGPCLSVTDATSTPNAVNLYLTKTNKPTSAPPHTDKQDVVVVQSTGVKHWKVYGPPDPSLKPQADPFARGKMTDALPLHRLEATSPLLLETDLRKGDVLFVPGGFPHTTSTTIKSDDADDDGGDDDGGNVDEVEENSLHLTFNIDHLVWDLSYLSARRLALRRSHVRDPLTTGDYSVNNNENDSNLAVYVGGVNKLPLDIHQEIMAEIPLGFLDDDDDQDGDGAAKVSVEDVTAELKRVSKLVDEESFSQVPDEVWMETIERLKQHGKELLDIHRDMYLAALDEGRQRILDDKMTAHLRNDDDDDSSGGRRRKRKPMTPERMQRLSLFRVQRYYEKVDRVKNELLTWSYEGQPASTVGASTDGGGGGGGSSSPQAIPADWAFTMPVSVGDQVEADLGGAFFPATVVSVDPSGSSYNVQFFDGDRETLDRSSIKLLKPPKITSSSVDDIDTTDLTPKQIKRLKKQQQKKNKK
mmetsp:Transcript_31397/g.75949  ORF Transcript_31397/g.75949 Transcript_31397/m.75949 type:complete len:812 (+) Transcript_31397:223-2658(+)